MRNANTPTEEKEATTPEPRAHVAQLTPVLLTINSRRYQIAVNHKGAVDPVRIAERYDEILSKYDYIVGDWGYEQLRLKGFYSDQNHTADPDQRIGHVQDYLLEFCNFGCAYFILERIDAPEKVVTPRKPRRQRPHTSRPEPEVRRSNREQRSNDNRHGRRPRSNKPYAEKHTGNNRPERGRSEQATTAGKGYGRHFTVRKTD